ncbi:MAG TPA: LPS export ABC transporter permease LptG [Methylomirabilota bacterium]|nr:LPS export ABC transporter permease LptG [Methylomirabilota bacterium]
MRPILDRYVWRELITPFLLGAFLFTFFLLTDRIFSLVELIVNKGVPALMVGQLLLYILPSFIGYTLPMAVLLAVLVACSRLASDFEVVGFHASGVSPLQLFKPFLLFGATTALVASLLTIVVGPWGIGAFKETVFRIVQTRAAVGIKERLFNSTFAPLVLYVEEISPSQVGLRGLLISDERDPKLSRIITAREGRLLTDEVNRRITLRLIDGAINEMRPEDFTRYRHAAFGLYDINLSIESSLTQQMPKEKAEQEMRVRELLGEAALASQTGENPNPFLVELHKRFAVPAAAIAFALIGFPLGIRARRGGKSLALATSLVILMAYYVLFTTGQGLAINRRIPPWVAMWTPNLMLLLGGGALFLSTLYRERQGPAHWWWQLSKRFAGRRPAVREEIRLSRERTVRARARNSSYLIDRYLIREFLTYLVYGLGVATCLFIVVDLLQTIDRYLRLKPPLLSILEHFLYRTPPALYQGLPIVVLLATILLFLALTRQNELTALKAAGVSLHRVSAPILALAIGLSAVGLLFQETLLPVLNQKGEEVDRVKIRKSVSLYLQKRTQFWVRSSETRFFHMDLFDPASQEIDGITILEIDRDYQMVNRLDAKSARWTRAGWEFRQGFHREFPGNSIEEIPFTVATIELPEKIQDFSEIQKPPELMSLRELQAYVNRLEETGHRVEKYLVELYSKTAFPLASVIMAVVGIPFALQSPRRGRLIGIGLAILLALGYWVIHSVAISLAKAGLLPPMIAAWTANLIFAGLGFALFFQSRT